ncbi:hypothetical protein [Pseudomonas thivervalensis]|uniref:hypothetical protein n=1 Tax=Pseudomonas thivervalensis TaxID=86265 RepID=UPI003D6A242A
MQVLQLVRCDRQQSADSVEKVGFSDHLNSGTATTGDRIHLGILTIMLFQEAHRVEILATGVLSVLVIAAGLLVTRCRKLERLGAVVLD